jgi:hypothetical protein
LRVTYFSHCDAAAAASPKFQSPASVVASDVQCAIPKQGPQLTEPGQARTKHSSPRVNRFQFRFCIYRWPVQKPSISKSIQASAVAQLFKFAHCNAHSPRQRRTCQPNRASQRLICVLSMSGLCLIASPPNLVFCGGWSLTLRSSRAPTAGHQARAVGARHIFHSPSLASHRCCRLSSNVRHQNSPVLRSVPSCGTITR